MNAQEARRRTMLATNEACEKAKASAFYEEIMKEVETAADLGESELYLEPARFSHESAPDIVVIELVLKSDGFKTERHHDRGLAEPFIFVNYEYGLGVGW